MEEEIKDLKRLERENLLLKQKVIALERKLLIYLPYGSILTDENIGLEDFPTDFEEFYRELDEYFRR